MTSKLMSEKLLITRLEAMDMVSMVDMPETFNSFIKQYKIRKHKIGRNTFFNPKEIKQCLEKREHISITQSIEIPKAPSGRHRSGLKVVEFHSVQR